MSTNEPTDVAGREENDDWLAVLQGREQEAEQQEAARRGLRDRQRPAPEARPQTAPAVQTVSPKRPSAPKAGRNQLPIGGAPRVDLLPPDLRAQRAGRRARDGALVMILIAALVLLAGMGGAWWLQKLSTDLRDAAQATTEDLTARQAQFAEVNGVLADIRTSETALDRARATDILWASVLVDLQGTLPPGARVTELTIQAPAPATPLSPATDVLQGERAATVSFKALATNAPDASAWMRAVEQIGGVVFVAPRVTQVLEDQPGYTVEMVFDLSSERLITAAEEASE